jgi:hypothetical protein
MKIDSGVSFLVMCTCNFIGILKTLIVIQCAVICSLEGCT